MEKLYCYVDETGQDTNGRLFVVSVVIAKEDRAALRAALEQIETSTGKGRRKWTKSRPAQREAYARAVLADDRFLGTLFYDDWPGAGDYPSKTLLTIANSVLRAGGDDHKATVYMDGLPKSQHHSFRRRLSAVGVKVKKVRGRKEESDALMRLADAFCGFVREAIEGKAPFPALLRRAERGGFARRR